MTLSLLVVVDSNKRAGLGVVCTRVESIIKVFVVWLVGAATVVAGMVFETEITATILEELCKLPVVVGTGAVAKVVVTAEELETVGLAGTPVVCKGIAG